MTQKVSNERHQAQHGAAGAAVRELEPAGPEAESIVAHSGK